MYSSGLVNITMLCKPFAFLQGKLQREDACMHGGNVGTMTRWLIAAHIS